MPHRLTAWMFTRTVPYWRRHGVDKRHGGFHERLDAARMPVDGDAKRVLVQARQIYTFCRTAELTDDRTALDVARSGFDFLRDHCRHPDGGWRFAVTRDGGPVDDRRDLYAHAFVLLALAAYHHAEGDSSAHALAGETIAYLDGALADPAGGYREGIDGSGTALDGPRRQNPHMHLLEAFLEWFAVSGEPRWLDRARSMLDLFERRFFVDGSLREYFDDRFAPAPGAAGRCVEPGHHFEWVWLLDRHRTLSGNADLSEEAEALYRFALAHGIGPGHGGVIDSVDNRGTVLQAGRRLWPQAEAIKAHLVRWEATGDDAAKSALHRQVDALFSGHLDGAPVGAWREHLDENGEPCRDDLPASSLYHLCLAAAELQRAGLTGSQD
ncbi:MAG: AGE family epimerase/isomerase [Alphaproteobacteria bacterium]|nr:AGE family epimerase/isomerase [Alphaproteobacteria bacterium]